MERRNCLVKSFKNELWNFVVDTHAYCTACCFGFSNFIFCRISITLGFRGFPPDCRLQLQKNRKPPDTGYISIDYGHKLQPGCGEMLNDNWLKQTGCIARHFANSSRFVSACVDYFVSYLLKVKTP